MLKYFVLLSMGWGLSGMAQELWVEYNFNFSKNGHQVKAANDLPIYGSQVKLVPLGMMATCTALDMAYEQVGQEFPENIHVPTIIHKNDITDYEFSYVKKPIVEEIRIFTQSEKGKETLCVIGNQTAQGKNCHPCSRFPANKNIVIQETK